MTCAEGVSSTVVSVLSMRITIFAFLWEIAYMSLFDVKDARKHPH